MHPEELKALVRLFFEDVWNRGNVAEEWTVSDALGLLWQEGYLPIPAQAVTVGA